MIQKHKNKGLFEEAGHQEATTQIIPIKVSKIQGLTETSNLTFSAITRSPTSRVGYIDNEGIDLGSANAERNRRETVTAVKAALASSDIYSKSY